MNPSDQKLEELKKLPQGTLGRDIAECLEHNGLSLVPKFESHDLKHVVLGFRMTPIDEIRMQAFMLGNGNYSFPCIAILLFGIFLLPSKWSVFYSDFKNGQKALPISTWTIEDYADLSTLEAKQLIFENSHTKKSVMTLENISKYGAISSIFAGVFGMIFCFPFLFSSSIEDLVGAGFPFIAGAILVVGGLLALSNLQNKQGVTN